MFHPIPQEPAASFTVTEPVIVGQPAVFKNNTTGQPPISYTWSFGDGYTSTLPAPTHVYTQAGNLVVGLTAVNAFGSSTVTHTIEAHLLLPSGFMPYVPKP